MTTQTVSVPDISCNHCKTSIEGAIGALAGIESVSVDIPTRTVALAFDDSIVSMERIAEAMTEIGYEITTTR